MSKRNQRLKGNKNKGGHLEHLRKAVNQWDPNDNACVEEYKQDVLKKITHMIYTLTISRIIGAESKEEIDSIVEEWSLSFMKTGQLE